MTTYIDPDTGIELVTVWSCELERRGLACGLSGWKLGQPDRSVDAEHDADDETFENRRAGKEPAPAGPGNGQQLSEAPRCR